MTAQEHGSIEVDRAVCCRVDDHLHELTSMDGRWAEPSNVVLIDKQLIAGSHGAITLEQAPVRGDER